MARLKNLQIKKCRLNMQGEFDGTSRNICGHMVVFERTGDEFAWGTTLNNYKRGRHNIKKRTVK